MNIFGYIAPHFARQTQEAASTDAFSADVQCQRLISLTPHRATAAREKAVERGAFFKRRTKERAQLQSARECQVLGAAIGAAVQLDAMSQSIALKERTLATLLDQYEDARIQETLLANAVSVIEPAYLPDRPATPRVALNLVLGIVVGLISGLALALLVENLDTRLHTSAEIEELTQMPTIGKIPSSRDSLHIARVNNGHYPQLEAFRRLRTNILTTGEQGVTQVVLLTSAQRGEGKSTVSSNLAVTLAQSGRKVILVDCDMRLPTVHKVFDLPNKRGLTSVLTEEVGLDDAILYSTFPRLHILTSGPLPPNPTELLGSPQLVNLVKRMKEDFD